MDSCNECFMRKFFLLPHVWQNCIPHVWQNCITVYVCQQHQCIRVFAEWKHARTSVDFQSSRSVHLSFAILLRLFKMPHQGSFALCTWWLSLVGDSLHENVERRVYKDGNRKQEVFSCEGGALSLNYCGPPWRTVEREMYFQTEYESNIYDVFLRNKLF